MTPDQRLDLVGHMHDWGVSIGRVQKLLWPTVIVMGAADCLSCKTEPTVATKCALICGVVLIAVSEVLLQVGRYHLRRVRQYLLERDGYAPEVDDE